jgi:hypothetical protein
VSRISWRTVIRALLGAGCPDEAAPRSTSGSVTRRRKVDDPP